jgi:hypothetical protein
LSSPSVKALLATAFVGLVLASCTPAKDLTSPGARSVADRFAAAVASDDWASASALADGPAVVAAPERLHNLIVTSNLRLELSPVIASGEFVYPLVDNQSGVVMASLWLRVRQVGGTLKVVEDAYAAEPPPTGSSS